MPYPARMVRVAIVGTLADNESMVHTFHVKDVSPAGSETPSLQALADGLRDKWASGLVLAAPTATMATQLASTTRYTRVTAYRIDESTGRASDLAEASFAANVGGTSSSVLPTELALCATTSTGKPGRSRRGRLYFGGFGHNALVTSTGRAAPACTLTAATFLSRFFRDVRNIDVGTGQQDKWEPQVVSVTQGTAGKITAVQVGDVLDVQRRRRNKIQEARTSVTVG